VGALAPAPPTAAEIERVVIGGDLSKLSNEQRVVYYQQFCTSLGLNWLTKPFEYITLNGKLTLYARKDATDQLRAKHGVSIDKPDITFQDEWIIVTVLARTQHGRTDADIGVVSKRDMRGDYGNALMKAVTKAKRRVTLSICGLGMLDESEVSSVPDARPVGVDLHTGEVLPARALPPAPAFASPVQDDGFRMPQDDNMGEPVAAEPPPARRGDATISEPQQKRLFAKAKAAHWTPEQLRTWLGTIGVTATDQIRRSEYDDIIAHIEQGPIADGDAPF